MTLFLSHRRVSRLVLEPNTNVVNLVWGPSRRAPNGRWRLAPRRMEFIGLAWQPQKRAVSIIDLPMRTEEQWRHRSVHLNPSTALHLLPCAIRSTWQVLGVAGRRRGHRG
jgi:hypothetical protein